MGLFDEIRRQLEEAAREAAGLPRREERPAPIVVEAPPPPQPEPELVARRERKAARREHDRAQQAAAERISAAARAREAAFRARLHDPAALREAILLKEILDRPVALRRRRLR